MRWEIQKGEPCLFYLVVYNTVKQYENLALHFSVSVFHPCVSSLFVAVGSEAHENEGCYEVFRSVQSYISKHLLIISTEWTRHIRRF